MVFEIFQTGRYRYNSLDFNKPEIDILNKSSFVTFENEQLFKKKYFSSYKNDISNLNYIKFIYEGKRIDDTSILYNQFSKTTLYFRHDVEEVINFKYLIDLIEDINS